jgi:acid phosphatase
VHTSQRAGVLLVTSVALALGPAAGWTSGATTVGGGSLEPEVHPAGTPAAAADGPKLPGGYRHLVVIYEENHSFDNLYGLWGRVGRDRVDGLRHGIAPRATQAAQDGTPYKCLLQVDVNLTSPPLPDRCQDPAHGIQASAFRNRPFLIDRYIQPEDRTCPAPGVSAPNGVPEGSPGALPGGCTRDLVHRFYQEKYQIHGGRMDRYVTGSDAVGLTMGHYDTKALPIYRYLHSRRAPHYVVADRFFQAANGGSFLNHQYLVAARAPVDTSAGGKGAKYSVLDDNGMPTSYPLYKATNPGVVDGQLTRRCPDGAEFDYARACGAIAVNTVQPSSPPFAADQPQIPLVDDKEYPTIGDRLSGAGISWAWYSGGWADAVAGHPGPFFQFHHQPLNYFENFAEGGPGRGHLQDESVFLDAARSGHLPAVSFVKPYGAENEHPGYASEHRGSSHLVRLLKVALNGPDARNTLVVVTYDEFGGQWDHVPPPGTGSTPGVHDAFGPGTRIPALVLARGFRRSGVDHRVYDTTSILAMIERAYGLAPLSTRDAQVADLAHAVRVGRGRAGS